MKKFNRILEQYVKENESLTRVRLKVDPKDRAGIDFRNFDGYEGYILKEGKYFNILIEGMDFPIMQVPFSIIKVVDIKDKDTFDRVRVAAIEKLNNIKDITPELINKFKACNSVDFFEEFLKEEGLSESDIKDIYKNYIFADTLAEMVNWGRVGDSIRKGWQGGKKIAKGVGTVLFPTYGAQKLVNWLDEKIPNEGNLSSKSNMGSTQQITSYQNTVNQLPKVYVSGTAVPRVSAAITQNPNFQFEPIYNGYINRNTLDIITIIPANNGANLQIYNNKFVNPNNLVFNPQVKSNLDDYFNNTLPKETSPYYKFNSQSVFEIARAPLLPSSP